MCIRQTTVIATHLSKQKTSCGHQNSLFACLCVDLFDRWQGAERFAFSLGVVSEKGISLLWSWYLLFCSVIYSTLLPFWSTISFQLDFREPINRIYFAYKRREASQPWLVFSLFRWKAWVGETQGRRFCWDSILGQQEYMWFQRRGVGLVLTTAPSLGSWLTSLSWNIDTQRHIDFHPLLNEFHQANCLSPHVTRSNRQWGYQWRCFGVDAHPNIFTWFPPNYAIPHKIRRLSDNLHGNCIISLSSFCS